MLTKSSLIADFILGEILSGHLHPGDRLPSRNQLARQFRCSRNSVERAMASLAVSGCVAGMQGSGTFVRRAEKTESIRELRIVSHTSPYIQTRSAPFLIPRGEFSDLGIRWVAPNCAGENLELLSRPDGAVIWMMPSHESLMLMKHLKARRIPQLLINREFSGFDFITTDPDAGIREGLRWLKSDDSAPIAFIGTRPTVERPYQSGRIIAFFEAAVELGVMLKPEHLHIRDFRNSDGEMADVGRALWGNHPRRPPDVFVLDQELAGPVVAAAESSGYQPGTDFRMLFFDDPDVPRRPGIAMMRQAYELFGRELTNWLRRGGTVEGEPFRRRLKTDLLVSG